MAALGVLETTGLTPAMVAIDAMTKSAAVRIIQLELNDLYGVCIKLTGPTSDVETAMELGRQVAEQMGGSPLHTILRRVSDQALPAILAKPEFSPLIQQPVVYAGETVANSPGESNLPQTATIQFMQPEPPMALGFIETQGFTAVFEAIDTACKAAGVEVVGKEKLGGGYVTVIVQGQLSAVTTAIEAGKEKVGALGKLIAAHVIARPSETVLKLLPKL